jgi:hypothetical protein
MYLMEVPAQYAPAMNHRLRVVRRRATPQLGFTVVAAAPVIAASGPAAPIVAAVVGIASLIMGLVKLFKFHGDPRDPLDAGAVEAGTVACYNIWYLVSGEALAGAGFPENNVKNPATWSLRSSAYPNVPKGPRGDPNADIDQAIQGVQDVVAQVQSQLVDPNSEHYKKSLQNPFFTNGGAGVIPLLEKVKAAREAAAVAPTGTLPASQTTAASLLPLAAGGLLLYALSAGG